MRKFLIISMPFDIGIGGYRRSFKVFPRLIRKLSEEFEIELYIPVNGIRTAMKFYLDEVIKGDDSIEDPRDAIAEATNIILDSINKLEKLSGYSFTINEKVLNKALDVNVTMFLKEICERRFLSSFIRVLSNFRQLFMELFEKKFWNEIRRYYVDKYSAIYSHHETVDALTTIANFTSLTEKAIILLQLDLGNLIQRTLSMRILKTILSKVNLTFFAVSPQPILKSPYLLKLADQVKIKVLRPSVAFDTTLLKFSKNKKERLSAIYFGRISKEKGIFDLIKAWKKVTCEEPEAKLTIIGKPDDNRTLRKFLRILRSIKALNITYLGYLSPNRLFPEVSRHAVLAYPSYRDSFSLTVLESLAMGLKVVAYDIPALKYIFSNSSMVFLVRAGDINTFANVLLKELLVQKEQKIDEHTIKLLSNYSSWDRVAEKEYNSLKAII
ncbi:MAG: hypothetical protein DRP01_02295 [Archaeoglobales archaeon]|nr:MAG: hypothetical protein DRP01_02295 [Archaeoglobales archaeon]